MNYLKQVNTFFELLLSNPLSANAQCLYFNLLNINNKCNWIEEFTTANSTLMGFTNLNKQALYRARNELIQRNLIEFKKGINQNQSGRYKIIEFVTANNTAHDTADDTADNTTDNTAHDTNNKLNKTKQDNKLNEFNLYGNFNENQKCDCISKSTGKQCERKSSYNINGKNYCNQHSRSIINKIFQNNNENKKKYGEYENVFFTEEQYQKLIETFPNDYEARIQRLDDYMQSSGKKYKDCLATIKNWARKEGYKLPKKETKEFIELDTTNMSQEEYMKLVRGEKDL